MISSARTRVRNKAAFGLTLSDPASGFLDLAASAVLSGPPSYVQQRMAGFGSALSFETAAKWETLSPHAYGFDAAIRVLRGGALSIKTLTQAAGDSGNLTLVGTVAAGDISLGNGPIVVGSTDVTAHSGSAFIQQNKTGHALVFAYLDGDLALALGSVMVGPYVTEPATVLRTAIEAIEAAVVADGGVLPFWVLLGLVNLARTADTAASVETGDGDFTIPSTPTLTINTHSVTLIEGTMTAAAVKAAIDAAAITGITTALDGSKVRITRATPTSLVIAGGAPTLSALGLTAATTAAASNISGAVADDLVDFGQTLAIPGV